jgi:hypothetical protein
LWDGSRGFLVLDSGVGVALVGTGVAAEEEWPEGLKRVFSEAFRCMSLRRVNA